MHGLNRVSQNVSVKRFFAEATLNMVTILYLNSSEVPSKPKIKKYVEFA